MKKGRSRTFRFLFLVGFFVLTALAFLQSPNTIPIVRADPFLGPPNYNSGFVMVGTGNSVTLSHDLGGNADDYLVILDCKDTGGQIILGTLYYYDGGVNRGFRIGDGGIKNNTVQVFRGGSDTYCDAGIRVRIWSTPPAPNYNSGFTSVGTAATHNFTHDVGGNRDNYLVVLDCKDTGGEIMTGPAYWDTGPNELGFRFGSAGVTSNSAQVFRGGEDAYCQSGIRVRIWANPPAANYNSGFVSLSQGSSQTLTHDLAGDRDEYVAILDCKDSGGQIFAGPMYYEDSAPRGFRINTSGITNTGAQVNRATDDGYCDQGVRVRIWPSTAVPVPATATPTVTATATASATASATVTVTPTVTATATVGPTATATTTPGSLQWVDRPPSAPAAAASCPGSALWLLVYWAGTDATAIATAAGGCASADVIWVNRSGSWMGFSAKAPAASDSWNVVTGEAHFIHAP